MQLKQIYDYTEELIYCSTFTLPITVMDDNSNVAS